MPAPSNGRLLVKKNRFRDWKILFLSLVLVCLATFCLQQFYFFCLPSTGDDSSSGRWLLSSADDGAAAAAAHPSVALYIFPRTAPPFCTRIGHRHYRITPSIHQGKIDKFANCHRLLSRQPITKIRLSCHWAPNLIWWLGYFLIENLINFKVEMTAKILNNFNFVETCKGFLGYYKNWNWYDQFNLVTW